MINNLPKYASDYEFIVATEYNDKYWFYGAFSDGFQAEAIATKVHGVIFHNVRIQGKKRDI